MRIYEIDKRRPAPGSSGIDRDLDMSRPIGNGNKNTLEISFRLADVAKHVDHLVAHAGRRKDVSFGGFAMEVGSTNDKLALSFQGHNLRGKVKFFGWVGDLQDTYLEISHSDDKTPMGPQDFSRGAVVKIIDPYSTFIKSQCGATIVNECIATGEMIATALEKFAEEALKSVTIDPNRPPFMDPYPEEYEFK